MRRMASRHSSSRRIRGMRSAWRRSSQRVPIATPRQTCAAARRSCSNTKCDVGGAFSRRLGIGYVFLHNPRTFATSGHPFRCGMPSLQAPGLHTAQHSFHFLVHVHCADLILTSTRFSPGCLCGNVCRRPCSPLVFLILLILLSCLFSLRHAEWLHGSVECGE